VWIYTQSNIKNIIFTWVHNIKTKIHWYKLTKKTLFILDSSIVLLEVCYYTEGNLN
jgi:hypothetical protein